MIRLTSVDFPTLGRPTTARTGTARDAAVGSNSWLLSGWVLIVVPSYTSDGSRAPTRGSARAGFGRWRPWPQRDGRRGCSAGPPPCDVPPPESKPGAAPSTPERPTPSRIERRARSPLGGLADRGLLDEGHDLVDHLVERVRRGVDVVGVRSHRQRCGGPPGVDAVSSDQVLLCCGDVDAGLLRGAARGPGARVGGEVDLDRRVRNHHGADVAAFDHDGPVPDDGALLMQQAPADLRHRAHRAHRGRDPLTSDRSGYVDAVDGARPHPRIGACDPPRAARAA